MHKALNTLSKISKLCPVDLPCQSNADSDGTRLERPVPPRVGNVLSFELWYAKGTCVCVFVYYNRNNVYPLITAGLLTYGAQ